MEFQQFSEAMCVIAAHHTSKVTINQPINNFVGDLGLTKFTIHINKCVPSVINKLIEKGFSLSMTEYGLSVDKF